LIAEYTLFRVRLRQMTRKKFLSIPGFGEEYAKSIRNL
jgi:hypothetical protein